MPNEVLDLFITAQLPEDPDYQLPHPQSQHHGSYTITITATTPGDLTEFLRRAELENMLAVTERDGNHFSDVDINENGTRATATFQHPRAVQQALRDAQRLAENPANL